MSEAPRPIIIKRVRKVAAGHHGGAWKVAYADFVTAMMAFFLVMWLVGTLPEEQLSGIAEYFKNPSIVSGTSRLPPPDAMGSGGAGTNAIKISQAMTAPESTGEGEKSDHSFATLSDDAKELQEQLEKVERAQLEELKEDLEAAIKNSQALAPFKDQLLLDITSEGLRIQIVDEQNRPMFDLGSASLKDYTARILEELAVHINRVPNRISISGHTDTTPYSGLRDYSNWELSADRANAARRALIVGGMEADKMARVVGLSSIVLFDKVHPTDPINRRISIVVMNKRTDDALTTPQGAEAEPDAGADDGDVANAVTGVVPPPLPMIQVGDHTAIIGQQPDEALVAPAASDDRSSAASAARGNATTPSSGTSSARSSSSPSAATPNVPAPLPITAAGAPRKSR